MAYLNDFPGSILFIYQIMNIGNTGIKSSDSMDSGSETRSTQTDLHLQKRIIKEVMVTSAGYFHD